MLAAKDREIDALYQQVSELQTEIMRLRSKPITGEDATTATVTIGEPAKPRRWKVGECALCDRGKINDLAGWKAHLRIKHGVVGVNPGDVVQEVNQ